MDKAQGETMFSMSHRTLPGSPGQSWFFTAGFTYTEDHTAKQTMLFGLSALMDILPKAIDGFNLHPLDKSSTLPPLTNNNPANGLPVSAVLAFQYLLVKNKSNVKGLQNETSSPLVSSLCRHDDEQEFRSPTSLWGVMRCSSTGNVKDDMEAPAWDIGNIGIVVWYKEHQSPDFVAQVLLMNVPPVFNKQGIEGEIR